MNTITKTALVTFVATFVVVVALAGALGVFASDDPVEDDDVVPELTEIDNPQYDADRVTSDRAPGEAIIEMDSIEVDNKVVVHVGMGISERDIAPLVNVLTRNGHEVSVVQVGGAVGIGEPMPIFSGQSVEQPIPPDGPGIGQSELDDAHGLISIGVTGYSNAQLAEIEEFVEDDGRLVMAVDPHLEFVMGGGNAELYSTLGVYTEPGYVYNLVENDLNYQRVFAEPTGTEMLTEGIDRVVFDTATPVQASATLEALEPIEGSELSTTREETDMPVLVRDNNVAFIGDTGFMTPENTQRADNDRLVGNIADFLVEADRSVGNSNAFANANSNAESDETDDVVTVTVGPDGMNTFAPEVTEIEPGTTVEFEWQSDGHTVVPLFQPEASDWEGVPEAQDEEYVHEHTFEEEGVYEFLCDQHDDEMFGVIIVDEPGP